MVLHWLKDWLWTFAINNYHTQNSSIKILLDHWSKYYWTYFSIALYEIFFFLAQMKNKIRFNVKTLHIWNFPLVFGISNSVRAATDYRIYVSIWLWFYNYHILMFFGMYCLFNLQLYLSFIKFTENYGDIHFMNINMNAMFDTVSGTLISYYCHFFSALGGQFYHL